MNQVEEQYAKVSQARRDLETEHLVGGPQGLPTAFFQPPSSFKRNLRPKREPKPLNFQWPSSSYIPHHDKAGKIVKQDGSKVDLCDCLDTECQGCFWSCPECESRMCGAICRKNRKGVVESIEIPGQKKKVVAKNPFICG